MHLYQRLGHAELVHPLAQDLKRQLDVATGIGRHLTRLVQLQLEVHAPLKVQAALDWNLAHHGVPHDAIGAGDTGGYLPRHQRHYAGDQDHGDDYEAGSKRIQHDDSVVFRKRVQSPNARSIECRERVGPVPGQL